MSATDNLSGPQFHSVQVSAKEHTKAVSEAQARNPRKYWSVSPPEPHTVSFAVRDEAGATHGYYALGSASRGKSEGYRRMPANRGAVYAGGLVNTDSETKGVGKYVMNRTNSRNVKLDAFSGPLEGYYKDRGFKKDSSMKWDDRYAPSSWKPEDGRSDVVNMSRRKRK